MRNSHSISAKRSRKSTQCEGFALVVIAALFTAGAVVGTVALDRKTVSNQIENSKDQHEKATRIAQALTQYALKNGRLPCPAPIVLPTDSAYGAEVNTGKCTTTDFTTAGAQNTADVTVLKNGAANTKMLRGTIPFRILGGYGLAEEDMYDEQGNIIMYIANRELTTSSGTANDFAQVADEINGGTHDADFVVLSYGRDKRGGIPRGNTAITIACAATEASDNEIGRKNCDDDINFITRPQNTSPQARKERRHGSDDTKDNYFDDDIIGVRLTDSNTGKLP